MSCKNQKFFQSKIVNFFFGTKKSELSEFASIARLRSTSRSREVALRWGNMRLIGWAMVVCCFGEEGAGGEGICLFFSSPPSFLSGSSQTKIPRDHKFRDLYWVKIFCRLLSAVIRVTFTSMGKLFSRKNIWIYRLVTVLVFESSVSKILSAMLFCEKKNILKINLVPPWRNLVPPSIYEPPSRRTYT